MSLAAITPHPSPYPLKSRFELTRREQRRGRIPSITQPTYPTHPPTRPIHPLDLGWVVPFRETSVGRLPFGLWVHGRLGVRLHHLMCGVRNYSFENFAGCLKLAMKGNHA